MRRITLIAVALCLIMLATVGAGVVAAKQTENPRQAGKSSVYLYDVAPTDTHGSGKLMINVKEHTFVFNGKGFNRDTLYTLRYRTEGSTDFRVFASGKATPSGNLHVAGTWTKDAALPSASGFGATEVPSSYEGKLTDFSQTYYVFKANDGSTFHINGLPAGLVGQYVTVLILRTAVNPLGGVSYSVEVDVAVSNAIAHYDGTMTPVTS